MNENGTVVIRWSWEDIQSLQPYKSEDECRELLNHISNGLHDRSIEIGWEILESLIEMETAQ
jgi:hypothetical protein